MGWTNAYLSDQVVFVQDITIAAGATGSTDVEGTSIDMQSYNCTSICFVVAMGPITTGAATHITVQQSDNTGFSENNEDIVGTKQTIADDKDNTLYVVDIIRPERRFLRLHMDRATQASTCFVLAILYGFKELPVTQVAAQVTGKEQFKDVVGGTA